MGKKITSVIFIICMLVCLTGCTDETSEDSDTIKIGLMVSLTGTNVQQGEEMIACVEMFQDIINNEVDINLPFHDVSGLPNLGGAKVEYVLGDCNSTDVTLTEAERLITEEGVIGIAGSLSSATTKTAMVSADKYGCIVLSEGTAESLLDQNYTYFGRTFPGDSTFIDKSCEYIEYLNETENTDLKTVALISEDSEFGTNIANVEIEACEKYGFEVVENISYNAQATNLTSEVLRLKEADADVVLASSFISDALLLVSTMKEQDYFPEVFLGQRGGYVASDFVTNLGEDAEYICSTARWNGDIDHELTEELNELYLEYSDGIALKSDVLASAWDWYLIAIIANQCGSTDPDVMRAEMSKGIDIDPAQDPTGLPGYVYGENGANVTSAGIIIQVQDGEWKTVYPEEDASEKPRFAEAWSDR